MQLCPTETCDEPLSPPLQWFVFYWGAAACRVRWSNYG